MPLVLAIALLGLVLGWILSASLLDKRWYEVLMDVIPYGFIAIAMLRTPAIMTSIVERMKEHERSSGEDPDVPITDQDGNGPTAIAL